MIESTSKLLNAARRDGYAIGAFNVYNLEGAQAVIRAAEAENAPVLLQLHPAALELGGGPLMALCLAAAREASVPANVHLDHSTSESQIRAARMAGVDSVMADGSQLSFTENVEFTRRISEFMHATDGFVEAELGRLSGTEDRFTVAVFEERLTDPTQAHHFVKSTQVDALAVCVGNVHGRYRTEPRLDFKRLGAIRDGVAVPLVLHGASGLPPAVVRHSIELGVAKFNVNTELREAYLNVCLSPNSSKPSDLVDLMNQAMIAMSSVAAEKIRLFGGAARAKFLGGADCS
jgi:tagatose 1,6-diphosphate aldolase GatY/KbaY